MGGVSLRKSRGCEALAYEVAADTTVVAPVDTTAKPMDTTAVKPADTTIKK